jgi:nucleoside-triphosphatase
MKTFSANKKIFLTGNRGVGKSTIISELAEAAIAHGMTVGGFKTVKGGELIDEKMPVYIYPYGAKITEPEISHMVGKGSPDVRGIEKCPAVFDRLGAEFLRQMSDIIVMDEIGMMESDALTFQHEVLKILDSPIPVIGAIRLGSDSFRTKIKNHANVEIIEVRESNRADIAQMIY